METRRALSLAGVLAPVLAVAAGCTPPAGEEGAAPARPVQAPRPTEPTGAASEVLQLAQPRAAHRATVLEGGSVLITGGCTEPGCGGFDSATSTELFVPGRGLVAGPSMITPRASGTATLLADGRVLLSGGYPGEGERPTAAAEVYDPVRDEFAPVADLGVARADHTASLLPDGRVVIAGGFGEAGAALSSSEVFDPDHDTFGPGPDLSAPRAAHVAAVVGGAVVLVGGTESSEALSTTDLLRAGVWQAGPPLSTPRVKLGASPIGGHRILVVGGAVDVEGRERLATTEIVDLARRQVRAGPELSHGGYKLDGGIAVLDDGRVVIPSGNGLEVFHPDTGSLSTLPITTYDARSFRTMTPVRGDRVLIAGGYDDSITPTDEAIVVQVPPTPDP